MEEEKYLKIGAKTENRDTPEPKRLKFVAHTNSGEMVMVWLTAEELYEVVKHHIIQALDKW